MKPLREHYMTPTDKGDMLNVFEYIEALEGHIEEYNEDKFKLEIARLQGEFIGTLKAIVMWDIPKALKNKLQQRINENL